MENTAEEDLRRRRRRGCGRVADEDDYIIVCFARSPLPWSSASPPKELIMRKKNPSREKQKPREEVDEEIS